MQNTAKLQLELFSCYSDSITLEDIFAAYYECRRRKRKTLSSIGFEINYERNLVCLHKEINNRTYKIGKASAFVVDYPVKREIFAADFRDRIVHHFIIRKLMPLFEKTFSLHSYSCRVGKGTLYGINDIYALVKKCSDNYAENAYILKMDVRAFFINIDHTILYRRLEDFIKTYYLFPDRDVLLYLVKQVVFNRPQFNCIRRGGEKRWLGLPKGKSLFDSASPEGMPIGNLTSQIFANFYLHCFDTFIQKQDKNLYYGRYVDDFILIHRDKDFLKAMRPRIERYLFSQTRLKTHPLKFHLQSYRHGLPFLGSFLLPARIYVGKRMKNNFFRHISAFNRKAESANFKVSPEELFSISAVFNSYFGFMRHCKSFRLRSKAWGMVSKVLKRYLWIDDNFLTVSPCDKYKYKNNRRKYIAAFLPPKLHIRRAKAALRNKIREKKKKFADLLSFFAPAEKKEDKDEDKDENRHP